MTVPGGGLPAAREDLDRELRRAFAEVHLPGAPASLRASLENVSARAGRQTVPARWPRMSMLRGAAAVLIAAAFLGAVFASRLAGPSASARPVSGSPTGPGETASPTAPSESPAGVIPWAAATPPPEPGRPTPRPVPPGTPACAPADLTATAAWGGATGTLAGGIRVTNVGSAACVIDGPPRLVTIRAGNATITTLYTSTPGLSPDSSAPLGPGLLEPGDQGTWWLSWSNWCGADLVPTTVVVTLPDGSGPLVAGPDATTPNPGMGGTPRCDAPGRPSSLTVAAFEYLPPEPALLEPQPAAASISAPREATAGRDIAFTVSLTNLGQKPAVFDPCPTYSEDILIGGLRLKPPADREYALNCSAMPRTLAPGATIVLEVRYSIPSYVTPGPAELLWSLDPGGPFSSGAFGRVPIDVLAAPPAGSSP